MKKVFTFVSALACAMLVSAQTQFVTSPEADEAGFEYSFYVEGGSNNGKWAAGSDQNLGIPAVWDIENEKLVTLFVLDSNYIDPSAWGDFESEPFWEPSIHTGTMHAVNNRGLAVGSFLTNTLEYISAAIAMNGQTGDTIMLYQEPNDMIGDAWAISADGSVIGGFYADDNWHPTACIWTNGGRTRIALPAPTEEQIGWPVESTEVRYMSADASVLVGYATDIYSGAIVVCVWRRNAEGNYEVDPWAAKTLHQCRPYDEITPEGSDWPEIVYRPIEPPYKPFTDCEPLGCSGTGEWVVAYATPFSANENEWPVNVALRINLLNHEYEIMTPDSVEQEISDPFTWEPTGEFETIALAGPELFGISNEGLAVGRYTKIDPMNPWGAAAKAVLWYPGDETYTYLEDLYAGDDYVQYWLESGLSTISPNGAFLYGTATDDTYVLNSFVLQIGEYDDTAIDNTTVHAATDKYLHNAQIIIVRDGVRYNVMGQRL